METVQCEKLQDNGERCSNRARPGTTSCQAHAPGRIVFTPASASRPSERVPSVPNPPHRVIAYQPSQPTLFSGLRVDGRGILVGPRGFIHLGPREQESAADRFTREVRLLGLLSQQLALPGQVRLLRRELEGDLFVLLDTPDPDSQRLSLFHDGAAEAARRCGGRYHVGSGMVFIQYRDDDALYGYDLVEFEMPTEKDEYLSVGREGVIRFGLGETVEEPLADFCLRVSSIADKRTPVGDFFALLPTALYPLVARYLRAHALSYELGRVRAGERDLTLLHIRAKLGARAGHAVPSFVLDYLSRLPRTVVLTLAHEAEQRRILLQWGYRFPLVLAHIAAAFPSGDLILMMGAGDPNVRVSPAPPFFDGDQLMDVHTPCPKLSATGTREELAPLRLPVLLRPTNGPLPAPAALLLTPRELNWLRTLLYRLPAQLFRACTLWQGKETAVLMVDPESGSAIPFGEPLRRIGDTRLFIPLKSCFVPELPWDVLEQAIKPETGCFAIMTFQERFDVPTGGFAPLSRSLLASEGRPCVPLRVRAEPLLALPAWTAPPQPEIRILRPERGPLPPAPALPRGGEAVAAPVSVPQPQELERRQEATAPDPDLHQTIFNEAKACEQGGDFLRAALYYGLIRDVLNEARCFRAAAVRIEPG